MLHWRRRQLTRLYVVTVKLCRCVVCHVTLSQMSHLGLEAHNAVDSDLHTRLLYDNSTPSSPIIHPLSSNVTPATSSPSARSTSPLPPSSVDSGVLPVTSPTFRRNRSKSTAESEKKPKLKAASNSSTVVNAARPSRVDPYAQSHQRQQIPFIHSLLHPSHSASPSHNNRYMPQYSPLSSSFSSSIDEHRALLRPVFTILAASFYLMGIHDAGQLCTPSQLITPHVKKVSINHDNNDSDATHTNTDNSNTKHDVHLHIDHTHNTNTHAHTNDEHSDDTVDDHVFDITNTDDDAHNHKLNILYPIRTSNVRATIKLHGFKLWRFIIFGNDACVHVVAERTL